MAVLPLAARREPHGRHAAHLGGAPAFDGVRRPLPSVLVVGPVARQPFPTVGSPVDVNAANAGPKHDGHDRMACLMNGGYRERVLREGPAL
jgi:hypothetical protein